MTFYPGLPDLYSLADTASYEVTVRPFLHQFNDIERVFYGSTSLWHYFITTNPIVLSSHLTILFILFSWGASMVTGNYSWVDRLWSIIPTTHTTLIVVRAYFSGTDKNGMLHARLMMIWLMQCFWTARLTRNYYRKGGYNRGSEDYRWNFVRGKIGEVAFQVLNVAFICIAQNLLLASLAAPTYVVFLVGSERQLNWCDVLAIEIVIFALAGQLRADDMQLRYQNSKQLHRQGKATFDDTYREWSIAQLDRGFVTAELWKLSRHPAFFLEQLIWVTFYAWGAVSSGVWLNWTIVGPLAYIVLFQCSTRLTEHITASKYPGYTTYQQTVGMLCPVPFMVWNEDEQSKLAEQSKKYDLAVS